MVKESERKFRQRNIAQGLGLPLTCTCRTVLTRIRAAAKLRQIHRPTQFHQAPLECGGGVVARRTTRHLAWKRRAHRPA
jgi:hypothetical protein